VHCGLQTVVVDKLSSVLVVIDPALESQHAITRAVQLARHFHAELELFLCDAEHAYALRHAYDVSGVSEAARECLEKGRRQLEALTSVLAEDVLFSMHVACDSPLYEAIVRRVMQLQPGLVVKGPGQRGTLDANDWDLARTCPVPLMFTRGRPWSTGGVRFAAALDVSEPDAVSVARGILQTAGFLAAGCGARLDVVYSDAEPGDRSAHRRRCDQLRRLASECQVSADHLHILRGQPEETLPAFSAGYDVLVLGALARHAAVATHMGTLTARLADVLDCDVVLVKSDEDERAAGVRLFEAQPDNSAPSIGSA